MRPIAAVLLLSLAVTAAYLTSFGGVMVFDDFHAIADNPTIRHLGRALVDFPGEEGGTVGGRPLLNFTFALNYAAGGLAPWGYHAVNLGIHLGAALALFGLVRRTLLRLPRFADAASPLALAVAALWALHPLQTESVTYLVQRAESLCGLLLLFTLYCFARGVEAPRPTAWPWAALGSCVAGMACKEVMAAAPLLVLLYDRAFVAGSWREVWTRRARQHGLLFSSWLLLAALVVRTAGRGGTAGFASAIAWPDYAVTQCHAILHYLRLAVWPHPQVFDYGTPLYSAAQVLPQAALLLLLLAAVIWWVIRQPALGFPGAWFFLVLAPSSSVVPVATQTMAEHRMYLPLAAVIVAGVLGFFVLAGRRSLPVLLALALAAGALAARRNLVYHSELALWSDTVAGCPENPRAHVNLGIALADTGRLPEAVEQFEAALRLKPDAPAHLNLSEVLARLGRPAEALTQAEAALKLEPASVPARINLARALMLLGRPEEAVPHFEDVLRREPGARDAAAQLAAALYELGNRAAARGDFAAAVKDYQRSLALDAAAIPVRTNLANALLVTGHVDEAIAHYREILLRQPGDARVRENLAQALELQRSNRP